MKKGMLKAFWDKAIKPFFVKERRETLFGLRYNKMLTAQVQLGDVARDRMAFFIAASAEDTPIRHYVDYIFRMEQFCQLCVTRPDSALAKGLDMQKMMAFKTAVDLLATATRNAEKPYLDRVRKEMPVPDNTEMAKRVRRAEIGMLREDVGLN